MKPKQTKKNKIQQYQLFHFVQTAFYCSAIAFSFSNDPTLTVFFPLQETARSQHYLGTVHNLPISVLFLSQLSACPSDSLLGQEIFQKQKINKLFISACFLLMSKRYSRFVYKGIFLIKCPYAVEIRRN